jgi:hypothetical protein
MFEDHHAIAFTCELLQTTLLPLHHQITEKDEPMELPFHHHIPDFSTEAIEFHFHHQIDEKLAPLAAPLFSHIIIQL